MLMGETRDFDMQVVHDISEFDTSRLASYLYMGVFGVALNLSTVLQILTLRWD